MRKKSNICCQLGFTLIELLITVAISGILMAGVYTAFKSQQDTYLAQDQVAEMQQNIRAGLDVMIRDMRMAGYDPTGDLNTDIVTAAENQFGFTRDTDGQGVTLDTITVGFSNANDINDDGIADDGSASLSRRINAGGFQAIAEDIHAIEFLYFGEGIAPQGSTAVGATQLNEIRSVQVSILARARFPDRNYTHNQFYCPASNPFDPDTGDCLNPAGKKWEFPNDNFRRRFQTMTVQLRNMGL